jgi:hypothetical protein
MTRSSPQDIKMIVWHVVIIPGFNNLSYAYAGILKQTSFQIIIESQKRCSPGNRIEQIFTEDHKKIERTSLSH